jgi:hypothetical protein
MKVVGGALPKNPGGITDDWLRHTFLKGGLADSKAATEAIEIQQKKELGEGYSGAHIVRVKATGFSSSLAAEKSQQSFIVKLMDLRKTGVELTASSAAVRLGTCLTSPSSFQADLLAPVVDECSMLFVQ